MLICFANMMSSLHQFVYCTIWRSLYDVMGEFHCLNLDRVQVSAAPNGRMNGVVASPNPQVASAGQWPAMGLQDYKNANMYGAGADAYQYYYGGEAARHQFGCCSLFLLLN